jgi:integrase/recombinase XerD
MVGCDDFKRHSGAATTLLEGISLATVQKIPGPDRSQTTAIDLNVTETHIREEFERKW